MVAQDVSAEETSATIPEEVPLSQRLSGWTSLYSPKIGPVQVPTSTRPPPSDFPSTSPFTYTSPFENARPIPSASTWDRPLYVQGPSTSQVRDPQVITRDPATPEQNHKSAATTAITAPPRPDWRTAQGRTVAALNEVIEQRMTGKTSNGPLKVDGSQGTVAEGTDTGQEYKVW